MKKRRRGLLLRGVGRRMVHASVVAVVVVCFDVEGKAD
jgi:hypothetical protein